MGKSPKYTVITENAWNGESKTVHGSIQDGRVNNKKNVIGRIAYPK